MSAATKGTKRRWAWAVGGATIVAAPLFLLLSMARIPISVPAPTTSRPLVALAKRVANTALDDEATLTDPTPLFLPTKWNARQKDIAPPEPDGTFQRYPIPPKLGFAETELKLGRLEAADAPGKSSAAAMPHTTLNLPDPIAVPAKPADALATDAPGAWLPGFGEAEPPVAARPGRGAVVEIVTARAGEPALPPQMFAQVQALIAGARPPGSRPWQSMEFLVAVNAAGLSGPPVITASSRVEEVDTYFKNFLVKTLRVGERLAPGFYRISVGP